MTTEFKVNVKIDGFVKNGTGLIVCSNMNEKQFYCTWTIYCDDVYIASKSEIVRTDSNLQAIDNVVANIEKFRIKREKVFNNIIIL